MEARLVFDSMTAGDDVPALLRSVHDLGVDELLALAFERGLAEVIRRGPKAPPDV